MDELELRVALEDNRVSAHGISPDKEGFKQCGSVVHDLNSVLSTSQNIGSEEPLHEPLNSSEILMIIESDFASLKRFALTSRIHAISAEGDSPLHIAARMGKLAVCDLFIRSGANPALLNISKQTPADVANEEGHHIAAQQLSSLLVGSQKPDPVDEHGDISTIEYSSVGTNAIPEYRYAVVQETVPVAESDSLDDFLIFEVEADPEEFYNQHAGETTSGEFVVLSSPASVVTGDKEGVWELDISPSQIAGDGIGSSVAIDSNHGTGHDFLKVRNRGRQSIKSAVIQTGTRLSVDRKVCTEWAREILKKGQCSFDDVDRLVELCEGNGEPDELRHNLHRNLESAGFDPAHSPREYVVGHRSNGLEVSSDDLAESIEATLTRSTRLPGTQRFVMDKSYEQQLLEPMVLAKQELLLGILASEVAVQNILNAAENILNGHRELGIISHKTIIPARPDHVETAEFMIAVEALKSWLINGRVMDGKQRREALAALETLDLSLELCKEMVCSLQQNYESSGHSIYLGELISVYEAAAEKFILEHLPYVRRFAARNVESGEDPEDVFQVAFIGLLKSTRRFDPERGIRFIAYSTFWMRQSLTRWRADEGASIRIPVNRHENLTKLGLAMDRLDARAVGEVSDKDLAVELGWTVDQVQLFRSIPREAEYPDSIDDWDALLPESEEVNVFGQDETQKIVIDTLAELSEREATVIRMRFGIRHDREMTLEEIGDIYGVTRERIRQIEAKGLKYLSNQERKHRLQKQLGM